jgi:hypothetical protein
MQCRRRVTLIFQWTVDKHCQAILGCCWYCFVKGKVKDKKGCRIEGRRIPLRDLLDGSSDTDDEDGMGHDVHREANADDGDFINDDDEGDLPNDDDDDDDDDDNDDDDGHRNHMSPGVNNYRGHRLDRDADSQGSLHMKSESRSRSHSGSAHRRIRRKVGASLSVDCPI